MSPAALQLQMSTTQAGLMLQVPSNLALHRVGARRWLSFIVIAWGVIATLFATMKVTFLSLLSLQA